MNKIELIHINLNKVQARKEIKSKLDNLSILREYRINNRL